MKTKLLNKDKKQFYLRKISFIILLGIISCRSVDTENKINDTSAVVKINITKSEFEDRDNVNTQSSLNSKRVASNNGIIQRQEISIDKDFSLIAEFFPIVKKNGAIALLKEGLMATSEVLPLPDGIKYKIVVYDAAGIYVTEKEFVNGKNDEGLKLEGNRNYTFIAYSLNSKSTTGNIISPQSLVTAKLSGITGDLMYFKKNMDISNNKINVLNIVLKHQFSSITTTLNASTIGNITAITSPTIIGGFDSAGIQFSDNKIFYNNVKVMPVIFPTLNQPTITSNPSIIIGNTTGATFNIGSITINGATKKDIKISNLNITPGVKYNLNITFQKGAVNEIVCPSKPIAYQVSTPDIFWYHPVNDKDKVLSYVGGNGGIFPEFITTFTTSRTYQGVFIQGGTYKARIPETRLNKGDGTLPIEFTKINGRNVITTTGSFQIILGNKRCTVNIQIR
ncbi:hypothetical protein CMU70_11440 [Elizabethkingia anophelis]|nr:hypothetical protein [Elizabethkingia anophelis]